jgi:hypothetical protein
MYFDFLYNFCLIPYIYHHHHRLYSPSWALAPQANVASDFYFGQPSFVANLCVLPHVVPKMFVQLHFFSVS